MMNKCALFNTLFILIFFLCVENDVNGLEPARAGTQDFSKNIIGPEKLIPLKERGILRLRWKPYKRASRFEFKPFEKPIYRIFIAEHGTPAREGRIHVTYDTSYPLTNLHFEKKYNILVDVEQNGALVLKEKTYTPEHLVQKVRWYAAPKTEGGSPNNSGSYNNPVDISFISNNAGPGDVIVLKSGVYFNPVQGSNSSIHDKKLHPQNSGKPGAHILYLAESNDLTQPRYVSFQTAWGNINVNKTDYIVFDGLNCDSDQGQNAKALTALMGEYDHRPTGIIVRNIYYRSITSDKYIMVNAAREIMIENCYFPGSVESHNVYICNNTYNRPEYARSRAIFRNNISINSTLNNIHANGFFDNFIIENNIFVGAKVANISLATVHRNCHVRNNLAYEGAKQPVTLNFYQNMPGCPLEDNQACMNIHICHNTFVVNENTDSVYSAILVSDTRRRPLRHVIKGLYIKNNLLVTHKKSNDNMLLNLYQSRHLSQMEVMGNIFSAVGSRFGYQGEIRLPGSNNEKIILPFTHFETLYKEGKPFEGWDAYYDHAKNYHLEKIKIKPGKWWRNALVKSFHGLIVDEQERDYRLSEKSKARGFGISDRDTKRIIRDLAGNVRNHAIGRMDVGALKYTPSKKILFRVNELQLHGSQKKVPISLKEGKQELVASATLKVSSGLPCALQTIIIEFVIDKRDKNIVIPVQNVIDATIEINGNRRKMTFTKGDKQGYEKFWLNGWAKNLNVFTKDKDVLEVNVFVKLRRNSNIKSIESNFCHDNIWAYDSGGLKLAITDNINIGFRQEVAP
jgi:hypothetical protein